jgi:hypothetical protein
MDFFKSELEKEFNAIGMKNKQKIVRTLPQTQKKKVDLDVDSRRKALMPGKRISASGKVYWETRKNRSDVKGKST